VAAVDRQMRSMIIFAAALPRNTAAAFGSGP
jgi:hypothetical protein